MSETNKEEEILEEIIEDLENAENKENSSEDAIDETKTEAEVDMDNADTEDKEEKSDKKLKKKEKKEKKDKKDEKIEELEDRVKRQMAEFENFRRRTEAEKSAMYGMGVKSVIEKILPVIDNFERGIQAIPAEDKDSPVAQGMNMIYKQLTTELENLGVKPIEAVGVEFDANYHNAVMQVESDEYESGIIAQELQKGYMYRDSVVRHSMVAVVQ
ncbi:MAG: nucleotide exchange factor GrpE [Lachnospiraceae bacterium]|nr:nucleotide exchange factor GrpE [Lachnospiraceae bacterium]